MQAHAHFGREFSQVPLYKKGPRRQSSGLVDKRIVLIDGEQLVRLMIRYGVGCRVEDTLYLKKIDEDFFE